MNDRPTNENAVSKELDEMVTRYDKRKRRGVAAWKHRYYERARRERDVLFGRWLHERFENPKELRCLEIGAGSGKNIPSFIRFGIPTSQVAANELLADRLAELVADYPEVESISGNALDIQPGPYDVIMVSTVMSSILDLSFRQQLALHLMSLLSNQGCILWYDFSYQNPWNKDVRGITAAELPGLFPGTHIDHQRVTLTPPVALLVGPLYGVFSWMPFLKSHVSACIRLNGS